MNDVERIAKERRRRTHIQDVLVLALYATAALTVAVTAPNALKLLKTIELNTEKKRKPQYRLQQAFQRLQKRGLVRRSQHGFLLTHQGKVHAQALQDATRINIEKPTKWDQRWRIVIFDVWERRRGVRDKLRRLLKKAGFYKLQNSVWVHPYNCEDFVAFIRTELRLGGGVLYLIAEGVENDRSLRSYFSLPSQ